MPNYVPFFGALALAVTTAAGSAQVVQSAKLVASDPGAGDRVGWSVAMDGFICAVGAPHSRAGGSEVQGVAHIFERSADETWLEVDALIDPDAEPDDYFGWSVAAYGDLVLVGAPLSRKVHSFFRVTWGHDETLTRSEDAFGEALAMRGGVAVVGAPFADRWYGAAFIYEREQGAWAPAGDLALEERSSIDRFAHAVAIDGDVLAVSEQGDDDRGESAGAVLIYERVGDVWTLAAKCTSPDAAAYDFFGASVAVANGRVLVGAPQHDGSAFDAGAVYVYERDESKWSQTAKIVPKTVNGGDAFGYALAARGDRLVAGAIGDDENGANAGATYVYEHGPEGWTPIAKVTPDDGAAGDLFGFSVAMTTDRVVVGAPRHDGAAEDGGAAYIFELTGP